MKSIRSFVTQSPWTTLAAILVFTLIAGMFLAYPRNQGHAQSAAGTITLAALVSSTPAPTKTATPLPSPAPTETPLPTPTPSPSAMPSPTATRTPVPSPTPRPAFLVWSPEGNGGYLRETPNGTILILLENGAYVESLSKQETNAGLQWQYVLAFLTTERPSMQQDGWIADVLLYPVPRDADLVQVKSEEGVYLRAVPQGNIVTWLGKGTPLVVVDVQEDWSQVKTLDERTGWVLSRLLAPLELPR